jgi:hypothetical protein
MAKARLPIRGNQADRAARLLMDRTGDMLVLAHDADLDLYLIAAVMGPESSEHLKPGTIEYQLSDGLPDQRSHSEDFTSLRLAVARYRELVAAGGWQPLPDRRPAR